MKLHEFILIWRNAANIFVAEDIKRSDRYKSRAFCRHSRDGLPVVHEQVFSHSDNIALFELLQVHVAAAVRGNEPDDRIAAFVLEISVIVRKILCVSELNCISPSIPLRRDS